MSSWCALLLVASGVTLAAADLTEGAFPLRYTAAEVDGGLRSADGQVVRLAAAADLQAEVRWTFPGTLPAGLWRLTVEFEAKPSGARNQSLGLIGAHAPQVDVATLDLSGPCRFVLMSSVPTTGLRYRKTAQRNQDTLGLRSLALERVTTPDPGERWCLECPVVEGRATFPWPLAPGNLRARTATPATLTWGDGFTTPAATFTNVAITKPISAVGVAGGSGWLQVERHPLVPVPDMPAGAAPLMTVVDPAKPEQRTLTLVGPAGLSAPTLATFPGGRRQAVFTTWDDGPVNDLEVAAMLAERNMRGTFLLMQRSAMRAKAAQLEGLGMEIGSHSWSHPTYGVSGYARCLAESVQMRKLLEADLKHPVISFAYPFGYQPAYDEEGDYVLRSIAAAGYWYARTTASGPNRIDGITQPLTLSSDFHFHAGATKVGARFAELIRDEGCVFHVWGHSYEVTGPGKATLAAVLDAIAGRADTWYATGGQVFVWRWMRQNTTFTVAAATTEGPTFTVARPWLHPYLNTVPMTIRVPAGVSAVIWKGQRLPVEQGCVDLAW